MLERIRKSKSAKVVSVFMVINFLAEMIQPMAAFALTGGPSQPEVQSFQPIGITDMVDPFTGDYSYNIPLLDVGGYPVNLIYNAGITMDQEASWVGLGWNVNPGAITRNMRGIPDDFSGDLVTQDFNMEANKTYGVSAGFGGELFGTPTGFTGALNYSLGVNFNNYEGLGFEQTISPSISAAKGGTEGNNTSLGLNITANNDGLSLSPSLSYSEKTSYAKAGDTKMMSVGGSVGVKINSRAGLQSVTIGTSLGTVSSGRTPKLPPQIKTLKDAMKTYGAKAELSGSNGSSAISLTNNTYVPQMDFPRINTSVSFSTKFGGTLFGLDGTFNLGGYYSENRLKINSQQKEAYGYLNEQFARNSSKSQDMLDFNREKDGSFTRSTPNLPLTNHSYDVFSIAGQGIGGMFRPFRGDVGAMHDAYVKSTSLSGSLGVELSTGNAVHIGADVNVNVVASHSGNWTKHNKALEHLNFQTVQEDDPYEPVYLKMAGEKTVDDDPDFISNPSYTCNIGGYDPVKIRIEPGPAFQSTAEPQLESKYAVSPVSTFSVMPDLKRYNSASAGAIKRVKRNTPVSYLSASEVESFGVEGYRSSSAADHHIAEVTVNRTDGARYIYGIAAYNTIQKEATFNISNTAPAAAACTTGLISYVSADASTSNNQGMDHYFNMTTTPAYAHSYLLTSVLSADYSDVDGKRGPSLGDLGSYTKFNYGDNNMIVNQPEPDVPAYNWRTPFSSNQASFNEGLKSVKNDNKASYIYGQKELWYLHNIETKTQVAVFHTSPRLDGFESNGEFNSGGGKGTQTMLKLDSISLYSLPDYKINLDNSVPIKRVHFEYDYSLCQLSPNSNGTDGSGGGKLTLKKVFFTYQRSYRGKLSPYSFTYAGLNPGYNIKGYDRWGYFAPNDQITSCNLADTGQPLPAADFPYVNQGVIKPGETGYDSGNPDALAADVYNSAWSLTSIKLPSGGEIAIDYEADDYAYVQDKNAMQMIKITGAGDDPVSDAPDDNTLYTGTTSPSPNPYLYFEFPDGASLTDAQMQARYVRDLVGKVMYFRFLIGLDGSPNQDNTEYISGYAEVDGAGITGAGSSSGYGYIKLKNEPKEDGIVTQACNPISKAAWQFCRLYNQHLAYGIPDPTPGGIDHIIERLAQASIINQMIELFKGPNKSLRLKGFGRNFVQEKSWVRLYNPDGHKKGGGVRVKKLRMLDKWETMNVDYTTNDPNGDDIGFNYGQEYAYNLPDGTSSGVAAYEPLPGGDENPFRKPVFFSNTHLLAPDDRNYQEEPFGESFFPAPGVGYSRVTVKNLERTDVKRHATGHTVHEFYTAKDFPTWTDQTRLDAIPQRTGLAGNIFNLVRKDYMTASQGFVVELNDMHGKPKAQWVYAEGQTTPISGVEYKYKTITETKTINPMSAFASNTDVRRLRLDNEVYVIKKNKKDSGDPDNQIVDKLEVGVDVDFTTDFRESVTSNNSFSVRGNLAAFLAAILPVAVPTVLPAYTSDKTRFRSAVTTKVVNRYGILRETIAHDLGSQVSTENLAWDAETGEVLLTKTKNNFSDEVYNFTYPAHWGYDRMGGAYRNIGYTTRTSISIRGEITNNGYLVPGDEVIVYDVAAGFPSFPVVKGKAWVWDSEGGRYLITKQGSKFPALTDALLKVIRSGRRNMQNTPIGTVTTLQNPLVDSNSDNKYDKLVFDTAPEDGIDILNASMQEYSEKWQTYCTAKTNDVCDCELNEAVADEMNDIFDNILPYSPPGILLNAFCSSHLVDPEHFVPSGCSSDNSLFCSSGDCNSTSEYYVYLTHFVIPPSCTHTSECKVTFTPIDISSLEPVNLPLNCVSQPYKWGNLQILEITGTIPSEDGMSCDALAMASFQKTDCSLLSDIPIRIHSDCIPFGTCTAVEQECSSIYAGAEVNPYVVGIRGDWRPQRSFAYQTSRQQDIVPADDPNYNNTSVRSDGKFSAYNNFWLPPSSTTEDWSLDNTNWTFASEVTQYSPYGFEIENRDALDRYSAAHYGYKNTLPKAVASNAEYRDIAFEGFEDYDPVMSPCCMDRFQVSTVSETMSYVATQDQAHTGRYSYRILSGTDNTISTGTVTLTTAACTGGIDDMPYTVKECELIHDFSPRTYVSDRDFVISFWVKIPQTDNAAVYDYTDVIDLKVYVDGFEATALSTSKSDIIDGWQRIEERYTIAQNAATLKINIENTGALDAYMDDIRVQPFNSSMKAFVYDPVSLRLWAELDERNFATFYEYDEDGALMRVKKETEKGIMTVQESRNHTAH